MENLYNLRTYIHDLNGSVMIRVRWEHKTRTVVFSCGAFADKSKWDSDQQRAQQNTVHVVNDHRYTAREINSAVSEMKEAIDAAFSNFAIAGHTPTVLELKEVVKARIDELHPKKQKVDSSDNTPLGLFHLRSLSTIFDEFIADKKDSMSWRGNYSEYHYRQVCNNIQECIKASERYDSIVIGDVDTKFLNELKRWYVENNYYNKTTNKQFSNLITVLRWAKKQGYPVRDDALLYKTQLEDPQKVVVFLKYDELQHFMDYPFKEGGHLDRMRDLFCFMALTSLRHSDLKALRKSDVEGDTIKIYTKKTQKLVLIPITERARRLINKYKDITPGERLFNVPSDQKMNDGIREAAKVAGLDRMITEVHAEGKELKQATNPLYKTLSCHDARRTFVCISLRLGIPAEIVMKSTGHSNYAAMKPYIEIMEESVTEQMQKWDSPQKKRETLSELQAQLAELQKRIAEAEQGTA